MANQLAYVFLDPDGTQGTGVVVVVQAPTGVTYASQVAGYAAEERTAEGFAVPNFHTAHRDALVQFFRRYRGNPPSLGSTSEWQEGDLIELEQIIGRIPLWRTTQEDDEPAFLALDRSRLEELTEGWIPVIAAFGAAILIHQNCD